MSASLIESIRQKDDAALLELYRLLRNDFIKWAVQHYSSTEAEAKDVFQEVMITLYENVMNKPDFELHCDIKTYLFSIGKYKLLSQIKKNARLVTLDDVIMINEGENLLDIMHDKEHNRTIVEENLNKLPEKEREILRLYYIEGHDMKTIAEKLGYKNADVAKKRKYEVFKKLAKLVKDNLRAFTLLF